MDNNRYNETIDDSVEVFNLKPISDCVKDMVTATLPETFRGHPDVEDVKDSETK